MNTTLLFVELLVTGLQSSVWVFILLITVYGYGWLQSLDFQKISDWDTLLTVFFLSFSYTLGIIMDRAADMVFSKWNKSIGKKIIPSSNRPLSAMRFELGKENEYLNNQFEYTRSRMRIARASSVNFGLITILALIFIVVQIHPSTEAQKWAYIFITLIVGGLLTGLSVYAWRELTITYYELIKSNYKTK